MKSLTPDDKEWLFLLRRMVKSGRISWAKYSDQLHRFYPV